MSPLAIIFTTIFVDLIGFGIVLPLLPFYAEAFGATPATIGLLVAVHPAMQFVFAPVWGRLSDRHGRRPILLVGLVGSGLSYLIFGLATNLAWLFASRIMAGVAGANVPVAQAYIADTTSAEDRTRGMGLVGAAFGLGFIAGPAIGGALSGFGYAVPGFFAAAISLVNAGVAWFRLPESLSAEVRARARPARGLAARLRAALRYGRRPPLRALMGLVLLLTLVFAAFTTVFPLFLGRRFSYDAEQTGYLLAYFGLLMAIVQGRLIGPLSRRVGERRLLVAGTSAQVLGYGLMGSVEGLGFLAIVLVLVAVGTGIEWPSITSLSSRYAGAEEQGAVLGVMQSLSAVGRMAGAAWAGWIFGIGRPGTPFHLNALLMAVAAALALWFLRRLPAPPAEVEAPMDPGTGVPV